MHLQQKNQNLSWFFAVGALHVTKMIAYMENMLTAMSKAAYKIVYRFRHLVMSFSEKQNLLIA